MSNAVAEPGVMSPAAEWTSGELTDWRSFVAMHHRLERHLNQHLQRDFGLSGPDFEILARLSEAPGRRSSVTELARVTDWEKSRLSHQLRRMTERGLLIRDDRHRRRHEVELTAAGWEAIRAAAPANAQRIRTFFVDVLGPDGMTAMGDASRAVLAAVDGHMASDCALGEVARRA